MILLSYLSKDKNDGKSDKEISEDELTVVTYNIGDLTYGKTDLSVSYKDVKSNLEEIISILSNDNYDFMLLQETNKLIPINYFVNASKKISYSFEEYNYIYGSNSNILNLVNSGNLTLSKYKSTSYEHTIPIRGDGIINNYFYVHKLLLETRVNLNDKELVVYNAHLPAYKENTLVREKHLNYIYTLAKEEYHKGNYVLIGGDFNMDLSKETELSENWKICKTNGFTHRSEKGLYRTIDGFILSPNLEGEVRSQNNFKYSDHSPAILKLNIK